MATITSTPFDIVGGGEAVSALVNRFYDLIEHEPEFGPLRQIHADDLSAVRVGLSSFLSGWLGGPRDWFGEGKCVMSLHKPIAIDPTLADQWSRAMHRAIEERNDLPSEFRRQMSEALDRVAKAMVNRAHA